MFAQAYNNRRVLVTGHTGFKGSWLALWLRQLGAKVAGFALDPVTSPNHWDLLTLDIEDIRGDIREPNSLMACMRSFEPEIVFHLAAQPLVRRSYRDPLETWSTNVMGTANVLEACRVVSSVQAIVCVTTDKVYANQEWAWGYRETDALGGHDPYSASKAACELLAASYRRSFFEKDRPCLLATVRAGNVIGGGDWSEDRLIPDVVRAATSGAVLEIRSPLATRPWQHVLECLSGYLMVGQRLIEGQSNYARAWNFGPNPEDNRQVIDILSELKAKWPEIRYQISDQPQPHEANLLYLDNSLAKSHLKWAPVWTLETTLTKTAEWYQSFSATGAVMTRSQLEQFVTNAQTSQQVWTATCES